MEYEIVKDSKTNGEKSGTEIGEIDLTPYVRDQVLQLNYKGLTELPIQLIQGGEFKHVTHLYLKRNKLTLLPENIKLLQNLVVLYLHSNELSSLPESIGELQNLKMLDVGINHLTCLPESIGSLRSLVSLKLAYNSITCLPKSIGQLKELFSLEAMNNKLKSLPLELFDCQSLDTLLLDSNQLTTIPRQLRNLSNLRTLSATGNNIIMLPFGFARWTNLESVFVDSNCYLSVLPIDISKRNVGFYECGSLPLSQLPDSILSTLCLVTIQHSETSKKMIPLPWEIRTQGNLSNTCVPTLLELCLRATHEHRHSPLHSSPDPREFVDEIPRVFLPLLECPTAFCYHCFIAIFIMAFPLIFQTKISGNGVYVLVLCCSVRCLRQTIFLPDINLVYPSLENLSLAVALV